MGYGIAFRGSPPASRSLAAGEGVVHTSKSLLLFPEELWGQELNFSAGDGRLAKRRVLLSKMLKAKLSPLCVSHTDISLRRSSRLLFYNGATSKMGQSSVPIGTRQGKGPGSHPKSAERLMCYLELFLWGSVTVY